MTIILELSCAFKYFRSGENGQKSMWKILSILSGLFNGKRSINFVKQITENFAIKSDVAETASITHLKYFLDI
tara:strand:+ start:169 stop:387 length:219 start_codon:yes stop_codon:yes gene_type:complete